MNPIGLRCNNMNQPLGVDTACPHFSWICDSGSEEPWQTGYQLLVSDEPSALERDEGSVWDSGEVNSGSSVSVVFQGTPLDSRRQYWWKVRIRNAEKSWGEWSSTTWFETGLLAPEEWSAQWIQAPVPRFPPDQEATAPAPFFRKSVAIQPLPLRARAYVSGLGYYELHINGRKCGDRVLSPAVSQYDRTVYYDCLDILEHLQGGENTFGAVLGNGWYNPNAEDAWSFQKASWRDAPKLLLQIELMFADGRIDRIVSNTDWKLSGGPIRFDGLKNGEYYDARLEIDGWCEPGFNDVQWQHAQIAHPPGGMLRSSQLPPIRQIRVLDPVSVRKADMNIHVFDFGENISGWGILRIKAPSGSEFVLRYGEQLDSNGRLDTHEIDMFIKTGEFQTDTYISKGSGTEQWHPRFVYHGFRYIEIRGLDQAEDSSLQAAVVHTDLSDAGRFECSEPLLNKIQELARRSTLTNYHSVPTDCPHREKNGWTGDAVLSAEQVLLNFDPVTAYRKWMADIADAQRPSGQLPGIVPTGGWGYNWGSGPAWDSALILIPWYCYLYAGDRQILEQNFKAMVRYLGFLETMLNNGIADFGLGDWCPPAEKPDGHKCPTALTDTAYAYVDFLTVAKIALILDQPILAQRFESGARKIRMAFRTAFIDSETGDVDGNSQTALACALYQGLVDDHEVSEVFKNLVDQVEKYNRHLDTGILGTKYLLHVLSNHGRSDLAFAVATQTDYPSWGHWIKQGATTLWERWDGRDSHNHHMFSDISAWFYRELAGMQPDPDEPGFRHCIFKPHPVSGLDWVKAHHDSPYGRVESGWSVDSGKLILNVRIPANCRGSVYLPEGYQNKVSLNGKAQGPDGHQKADRENPAVLELGAGMHTIISYSGSK